MKKEKKLKKDLKYFTTRPIYIVSIKNATFYIEMLHFLLFPYL